jgi:hypothetical protein
MFVSPVEPRYSTEIHGNPAAQKEVTVDSSATADWEERRMGRQRDNTLGPFSIRLGGVRLATGSLRPATVDATFLGIESILAGKENVWNSRVETH